MSQVVSPLRKHFPSTDTLLENIKLHTAELDNEIYWYLEVSYIWKFICIAMIEAKKYNSSLQILLVRYNTFIQGKQQTI